MRIVTLLVPLLATAAFAAEAPPPAETLVAQQTYAFAYTSDGLSGPGADFLKAQTASSQFVLFGEDHMDHEIPIFAGGVYSLLREAHGFNHLVVEQDPVAIEDALQPERRGDAEKLAAHAKRYPSLYEFDSDEDLAFVAQVARLENDADAIWGVEQATGAVRYLEELVTLAPNPAAGQLAQTLLAAARVADPGPKYSVNWLGNSQTPEALTRLTEAFQAAPDSRAARLLAGLVKSSEIFGFYHRAEAGEYVGLYNNTYREVVLKSNFLRRYHATMAARNGALPKAMFKFGANHLYHGKNPTQAFPIGNLAHELAIANGLEAYGLYVQPLGPGYVSYKDLPAWLLPLLPATEPTVPTLVNLRELRRYQGVFREKTAPNEVWLQRTLLHGYDAIVLLPGSRPSTKQLGGRD